MLSINTTRMIAVITLITLLLITTSDATTASERALRRRLGVALEVKHSSQMQHGEEMGEFFDNIQRLGKHDREKVKYHLRKTLGKSPKVSREKYCPHCKNQVSKKPRTCAACTNDCRKECRSWWKVDGEDCGIRSKCVKDLCRCCSTLAMFWGLRSCGSCCCKGKCGQMSCKSKCKQLGKDSCKLGKTGICCCCGEIKACIKIFCFPLLKPILIGLFGWMFGQCAWETWMLGEAKVHPVTGFEIGGEEQFPFYIDVGGTPMGEPLDAVQEPLDAVVDAVNVAIDAISGTGEAVGKVADGAEDTVGAVGDFVEGKSEEEKAAEAEEAEEMEIPQLGENEITVNGGDLDEAEKIIVNHSIGLDKTIGAENVRREGNVFYVKGDMLDTNAETGCAKALIDAEFDVEYVSSKHIELDLTSLIRSEVNRSITEEDIQQRFGGLGYYMEAQADTAHELHADAIDFGYDIFGQGMPWNMFQLMTSLDYVTATLLFTLIGMTIGWCCYVQIACCLKPLKCCPLCDYFC